MAMQGPDFLTKRQMREQIALPKVGVRYADGAGGVKDFSVGDASELGSLDAAFGAAAAGVRRKQNLGMADKLNQPKGSSLKPVYRSGIVIDDSRGFISLKGEVEGEHNEAKKFFGTDAHKVVGWHTIAEVDEEKRGTLVGPSLNVAASADSSKREISDKGCWSIQTSRTAFKKNEETGAISFYNYFRTIYFTEFGRAIGESEESEVLVGTIEGAGGTYCAKPVVDGNGVVTGIQFGTDKELKKGEPSKTASIGQYCVNPSFSNGVLASLSFGTQAQISSGSPSYTVYTQSGCPYQDS